MSYCRWSSDHFECDVYVYEDVSGGWTTHVAGRRQRNPLPDSIKAMYPRLGDCEPKEFGTRYMAAERARREWTEERPHYTIMGKNAAGEPVPMHFLADSEYISLAQFGEEAGGSFNDGSPGECADRLERLLAKGFNVPLYAIQALREEQAEIDTQTVGVSGE